ncbi:MAG: hypothetical protein KatS3mg114_0016 [Planctomycetaceae bacterium]|nr:MAG: hypothetical protein KatS3mg114_0016 [Planctomycetaceae bacterium]
MRIVAGRLRHRRLLANPGSQTRPMLDRAKVILFDSLGARLQQTRVLDLYCGTGTLGFEALSRGARSVVFCERDPQAHALLCENARRLGVEGEVLCWHVDVTRCSLKPKGYESWYPYDFVFVDPPYHQIQEHETASLLRLLEYRLCRPDVTSPRAELVLRWPRKTPLPTPLLGWTTVHTWDIASMHIIWLQKQEPAPLDPTHLPPPFAPDPSSSPCH